MQSNTPENIEKLKQIEFVHNTKGGESRCFLGNMNTQLIQRAV